MTTLNQQHSTLNIDKDASRQPPQLISLLSTPQPLQDLEIASTQVFYTAPRPGRPAQLRLLDPAGGKLHQLSYSSETGSFVPRPPERTDAGEDGERDDSAVVCRNSE